MDSSIQAGPSCRPKKQLYKKQKRSVNGSFLGRFGVADIFGKAICVMYSKEIAEESLKPNKLLRHMSTHKDVASPDEGRKHVFKQRFEQLTKSQAFLRQSLTKKQRLELFSYKAAYIVAREKRPHVEGEVVIKPVLESFVERYLKVRSFRRQSEMSLLELLLVTVMDATWWGTRGTYYAMSPPGAQAGILFGRGQSMTSSNFKL